MITQRMINPDIMGVLQHTIIHQRPAFSSFHQADERASGCCNHWGWDHLPAACQQRSDAAGL